MPASQSLFQPQRNSKKMTSQKPWIKIASPNMPYIFTLLPLVCNGFCSISVGPLHFVAGFLGSFGVGRIWQPKIGTCQHHKIRSCLQSKFMLRATTKKLSEDPRADNGAATKIFFYVTTSQGEANAFCRSCFWVVCRVS